MEKQETCKNCGFEEKHHYKGNCPKQTSYPFKKFQFNRQCCLNLIKRLREEIKREGWEDIRRLPWLLLLLDEFEKNIRKKFTPKNHSPLTNPTLDVVSRIDGGTSKSKPILPKTIADGIEKEGTSKSKCVNCGFDLKKEKK